MKEEKNETKSNQDQPVQSEILNELIILGLVKGLSFLDRYLAVWILLFMILGVIIGNFSDVNQAFALITFNGVSLRKWGFYVQIGKMTYSRKYRPLSYPAIAIGLIVMMWPVLAKVQRKIWIHMGISLILNWIIGPFIMLGLAWGTLPDLPGYRTGVILVGLARCIAMVMIWNQLAGGDMNYCAIGHQAGVTIDYGAVAKSVLIYLGIPLLLGISTRAFVYFTFGRPALEKFLRYFGPVALIGLLYTVIIIFASQGKHIIHNIGPVFRVFVPMILYFLITWTFAFALMWYLTRRFEMKRYSESSVFGYDTAVVQAFTAGSNNFELAIAVAVGVYGVDSEQALAATIGPLVEVPVLLSLTWVALRLRKYLSWETSFHNLKEESSDSSDKA
ncbi:hypothetical protein Clacol_003527 [Clathrus columnatus]|uniref:Uncharacterized protein n=1 Tax=Clathrus columnatus TaxID=1419009 RepID=A0AAV5A8L6_9AGAM|nr:hypothetical protein Clacol_003527 [Clathrus columnatus]